MFGQFTKHLIKERHFRVLTYEIFLKGANIFHHSN